MAYPETLPDDAVQGAGDPPADFNALKTAVASIHTELGSSPKGAEDDLTARLAALTGTLVVEDETGTSYTVDADDAGKVKRFTDAGLVTVTLPDALTVGFITHLLFVGAAGGAVQDNGTSVVNTEGTVDQHGEASCLVVATDTWSVVGTS